MTAKKLPDTVLPILLAGGEGTRLRPITADLPKPLVPVDGVPAICRILDSLAGLGVCRAVITVRYRADDIIELLGSSYRGIALAYSNEDKNPRGTAGGTRDAWERCSGPDDTDALIISGDAVFTCDLSEFYAFHLQQDADASLLCVSVSDPGAFGTVEADEDGLILGFSEKPCAAEALSDTVSTGIYCLSRESLEAIPSDGTPDFGQDIFPSAVRQGKRLFAYRASGYWCDIGSHAAYLACSLGISAGRIRCTDTPQTHPILPPHISDSSIGKNCFIPSTASVRKSILFDRVTLGRSTSVTGSIICADVTIGSDVTIESGCVIGHGCSIGDGQQLIRGTRLEPNTILPPISTDSQNRFAAVHDAFDTAARLSPYLSDIGYTLSLGSSPSPVLLLAFAQALAAFAKKQSVSLLICRAEPHPILRTIEDLLCGTLSCIADNEASFFRTDDVLALSAARMPHLPLPDRIPKREVFRIVLLHCGGTLSAAVFDDTGLYPTRDTERTLDTCFADALSAPRSITEAQTPLTASSVTCVPAEALISAYLERYGAHATTAAVIPFVFSCGTSPCERLLSRLLETYGGTEQISAPLGFVIPPPHEESGDILCPLTATEKGTDQNTVSFHHWQLLTLLSRRRTAAKQTDPFFPTPRMYRHSDEHPLSVPVCAPAELPSDYRYTHTPALPSHATADDEDILARRYAAMEAEDAVLLARDIALMIACDGRSLAALMQNPKSDDTAPIVPLCRKWGFALSDSDPSFPPSAHADLACLMHPGCPERFRPAREGIVCRREDGTVRIVSTRSHNYRIIADAYAQETADELFLFAKECLHAVLRTE